MKALEKLFGFESSSMKIGTEIVAGITTFLTMSYILAVNPSILSASGMDQGGVFTATAVSAIIATLVMAMVAKLPFALAPGMGLNAFFTYTVCLTMGYSWQFALTAVLIEGILFILLTVTKLREKLVEAIPLNMRKAIGAGIGLFIALIGLKDGGIIVANDATLISLGDITHGEGLLAVIGIIITGVLVILNVKGSILIGILATALIGIPMGITHFNGVVSAPPSLAPVFCKFDFSQIWSLDMLVIVFTFLFIDMFDTMGTLVGVSSQAKMLDENGKPKNVSRAFLADAIGTTCGALLGTSTVTTYVESASGVAAGGRSGLTAFSTAICFAIALFFAPLFLAIPSAALCPALVIVGLFMMSSIKNVDFTNYSEAIPAYLCLILIPFSYSISDGILLSMIAYVVLNLCCGKFKKISVLMYILAILFVLKYIFL